MNLIKKWYFWLIIAGIIMGLTTIIILFPQLGVGSGGISLEEYNKITIGTTDEDLEKIVAPNREWLLKDLDKYIEIISTSKDGLIYTEVRKIKGENGGYAIITLQRDFKISLSSYKVVKKEQFDLK